MKTKKAAITVSRADFEREEVSDCDPDLSHLGEYSDSPDAIHIDRQERGDMGRNEPRYFNAGCGDPEYIEQDYKRAESYNAGQWAMIGIRAKVTLEIPHGDSRIMQTIESPGLWGIESDSGEDYFQEVFKEESNILAGMLEALGVVVTD